MSTTKLSPAALALYHTDELTKGGYIHPTTSEDSHRDLTVLYASGLLDEYGGSRGRVVYDILQALGWDFSEKPADLMEIFRILNTTPD